MYVRTHNKKERVKLNKNGEEAAVNIRDNPIDKEEAGEELSRRVYGSKRGCVLALSIFSSHDQTFVKLFAQYEAKLLYGTCGTSDRECSYHFALESSWICKIC